jgi:hypothetical protein
MDKVNDVRDAAAANQPRPKGFIDGLSAVCRRGLCACCSSLRCEHPCHLTAAFTLGRAKARRTADLGN